MTTGGLLGYLLFLLEEALFGAVVGGGVVEGELLAGGRLFFGVCLMEDGVGAFVAVSTF